MSDQARLFLNWQKERIAEKRHVLIGVSLAACIPIALLTDILGDRIEETSFYFVSYGLFSVFQPIMLPLLLMLFYFKRSMDDFFLQHPPKDYAVSPHKFTKTLLASTLPTLFLIQLFLAPFLYRHFIMTPEYAVGFNTMPDALLDWFVLSNPPQGFRFHLAWIIVPCHYLTDLFLITFLVLAGYTYLLLEKDRTKAIIRLIILMLAVCFVAMWILSAILELMLLLPHSIQQTINSHYSAYAFYFSFSGALLQSGMFLILMRAFWKNLLTVIESGPYGGNAKENS